MILGCLITLGNPADSEQYQPLLEQHKNWYGRMPRQVSADGGFASKENLAFAKENHIKDMELLCLKSARNSAAD
ncbi:MAG: hypothetical protein C0392_15520 [Syntrophus sp. (in: bacteria)]|nr:hypothetical protein [Syntrophus sp. (in: bacteria)]